MQEFKKVISKIWDFSILIYIFGVIFFALKNNLTIFIISTVLLVIWFAWGRINIRVEDGEKFKLSTLMTGFLMLGVTIWLFLLGKCIVNTLIQEIAGYLIFISAVIMLIGILTEKKKQ
ncbi:hypothetical protein ACAG96_06450 [Candidatus Izemoplasma sp. B36]|uniref:hypothetical protein n=1 Tax=Candidatus Izemoplasma sp. B36 TaxID=3242468 RepID=UPI0035581A03